MNPWRDPREPRVTREDQARRLRERRADLLGNRFQLRRNREVRTSPERCASRQEAGRALWKLADDGRVGCTCDRGFHFLVLLATCASLRWVRQLRYGALVSPGVTVGPMRRGNFNTLAACPQAVASIAMPGPHCCHSSCPGRSRRSRGGPCDGKGCIGHPSVMTAGIGTGVHDLDQVNIGILLVILVVAVAAVHHHP